MRAFGVMTVIPILLINTAIVGVLLLYALGILEADAEMRDRVGAAAFAFFFGGMMGCYLWRGIPSQLGRCRLELQGGRITTINQAGLLKHGRSISIDRIQHLKVARNYGHAGTASGTASRFPEDWADLEIELEDGRVWKAATSYSRDLLAPLAHALADEINARRGIGSVGLETGVGIYDDWAEDQSTRDHLEQPAGSPIHVEQTQEGGRLVVPAPGLLGLPMGRSWSWGVWVRRFVSGDLTNQAC